MKNIKAEVRTHRLNFIQPATTSRDTLRVKQVWYVKILNGDDPSQYGIGEIAPILGLSIESEKEIDYAINSILDGHLDPEMHHTTPSVRMGLEMALADYNSTTDQMYFESAFASGLKEQLINGLVWMGDAQYMLDQVTSKLELGFSTLKLKIGTLDFKTELDILRSIRSKHSAEQITIRVDANGAFGKDAAEKLKLLSEFDLHSIEQPIPAGNWKDMAQLCQDSPLDIALDEELIGIHETDQKKRLLETIR
ncbi:MAG: O-succinylbenzoate synthase, partial [Flavobacteriales bacterium]